MTSPELELPDDQATIEDIANSDIQLIPGVNTPRPGTPFHLSPGTAACLQSSIAIRTSSNLQVPPDGESETLSQ